MDAGEAASITPSVAAKSAVSPSFGGRVAGIAGSALPGPPGQGADWANAVGNEFAYQPRTKEGQAVSDVVNYLPEQLMKGADYAGGKTTDITGSPALGAGVKTGIAILPSLLLKGRGTAAPAVATAPDVLARNFVRSRTGLDWNTLADATKQKLTEIAKDSETLDNLDPAALERQARLESLPVPIKATRGQITRDTADLTNEGTLASTETGRPLKAVRDAQSPAILANIDLLKRQVGGTAETPQQVGLSVQDAALRAKLRGQQKLVRQLYTTRPKRPAICKGACRRCHSGSSSRVQPIPRRTHGCAARSTISAIVKSSARRKSIPPRCRIETPPRSPSSRRSARTP
jgi:hypothetical protein